MNPRVRRHQHWGAKFGLVLLELLDLERLAADRVHEFLFVASPLRITGALGSPLNPRAVA